MPKRDHYLIRVFMVTYNSPQSVEKNLRSLFSSQQPYENVKIQVYIINNHSNFKIPPEFADRVTVLDNWHVRSELSCGHLSRDWNTALIKGFGNLLDPECDQVIGVHDDVIWHSDWLAKLINIHHKQGYTFYMGDFGCSFTSYLPEAVRKIGLWDERFCNIGYHEADYMLRARIYNPDKSTINDIIQGRVWNATEVLFDHPAYTPATATAVHTYIPITDKDNARNASARYHSFSRKIFAEKWNVYVERWDINGIWENPPTKPLIPSFIYYPYFEKDVEGLEEKGYIFAFRQDRFWYDPWIEKHSLTTNDPLKPIARPGPSLHSWGRAKEQGKDFSPKWEWRDGSDFTMFYSSAYVP